MPIERIDFGNSQESGWEELAGASPQAMNVVVDGRGAVRRRPGIKTYDKAFTGVVDSLGIDGLRVAHNGQIYAVGGLSSGGRKIYRVSPTGFASISAVASTELRGEKRPVITETGALLVLAAGRELQKVILDTGASSRLEGGAPLATHVIANNSRLLANNDAFPDQINFSDQAIGSVFTGHEVWTVGVGLAGFFSAEARPDPIEALGENTNEVFAFGRTNVQTFAPDPVTTYATVSTREYGCAAPYSVIKVDQTFAWLDHLRRIVVSDGRSFQVISDPIGRTLSEMTTVSDCYGFRIHQDPIDALVWKFPADGRTFAYQRNGGWSQWQSWDDQDDNWLPWPVTAHYSRPDLDDNVVGTSAGKLGVMDTATNTDLGERINAFVTTGFLDRGTDRRKHCRSVRFVFQRGETTSSTAPHARFSWRDDEGDWVDWVDIDLGSAGDTQPVVTFRTVGGVYRRRQWRFEFSDNGIELALASASEEFDVLKN